MDMEKQKGDGLQGDCRPLLPWSWLLLTAFSVLIKMTNIISFTNISAAEWEKSFVFASLAHPAFEWCCATGKMLGSKELLSVPGNVLQGFKLIIKNPSSLIIILCTLASSSHFMWNVNEKNEARNFLSHMSVDAAGKVCFASLVISHSRRCRWAFHILWLICCECDTWDSTSRKLLDSAADA